ncbi:MAG: AEC family transporter [Lachnospiraceae bacterium]|nr:AEC family transporter [Candidatus Colinaster equi]
MLDNLVFSLNATMPIFLMMVVGFFLKKIHMLDEHSTSTINKVVFRVFLPALLFEDLAVQDFVSIWDSSFVGFCALATVISIAIAAGIARFDKHPSDRGEFIQASFRSAAATLGIAFMTNVYDNVAMVALMIIGSVPIYNIISVLLLSVTAPDATKDGIISSSLIKKTLKSLITNPIILSILAGLVWSLLRLEQPVIMQKSITYLGNVASPLALIGLGASFELSDLKTKWKAIALVNFNKLFLFCLLFLPLGIYWGYRDDKLVALLIMLGSATTSSSFIMAKNMGHKGTISSAAVMTTTFLSSFTLTLWLFILRTFGYI